ncbi:unnamed protein product, partial [Meganyctiphanes norvegica]
MRHRPQYQGSSVCVVRPIEILIINQTWHMRPARTHSDGNYDTPAIQGLLVNTSDYRLPEYNIWDITIKKYLNPPRSTDCSAGKIPLTSINHVTNGYDSNYSTPMLVYHKQHERAYSSFGVKCCYSAIQRIKPIPGVYVQGADNKFQLGPCKYFSKEMTLIQDSFIYVKCTNSLWWIVYENTHSALQAKTIQETKGGAASSTPKEKNTKDEVLSVMFIGLDSMSRNNLMRYMPKTYSYLKEINAIDLQGYNKISDNTFPNLIPLLTGLNEKEFMATFVNSSRWFDGPYDNGPFIWKKFSEKGYMTSFGEDAPHLGTFSYTRKGFIMQPTDEYLRPFMVATEKFTGNWWLNYWYSYCYGYETSSEVLYDYAIDLANFVKSVPLFSFLWSTGITHDSLEFPFTIDEPTEILLRKLHMRKDLIVIFLSDHGMRYGGIRTTTIGKYEENTPFNFFILPESFKEKYKTAYYSLLENQKRLTTHFDIHKSLVDILDKNYQNETYLAEPVVKDREMSLFKPIPKTRNCKDSQIEYHYCAGIILEDISTEDKISKLAVDFVINIMNKGLLAFSSCSQLELNKIVRARRSPLKNYEAMNDVPNIYNIIFTTTPGYAMFEATTEVMNDNFIIENSLNGISRVNLYKG